MIFSGKKRKRVIAAFFVALLVVQDFYPAAAYALTSGPSQPEMQKFSPAGASDMVDLFSGDFKYDIPLMDVGGYPLNLAYHSGAQIEDEASWVGVGWSLNPGAVNRDMRGIPDDFTGDDHTSTGDPQDAIRTIQHQKEFNKIGGSVVLKPTLFGWLAGKTSLKIGVYKDNYYGIGADLGASVDFTLANAGCASLTAGLGITSDVRTGVTVDPSLSLSASFDEARENNMSLSGGFSYNTRSGLQSVNLGQSFNLGAELTDDYGNETGQVGGNFEVASFTKLFDHSYIPSFQSNTKIKDQTYSIDLGPQLFGGYIGIGGEGYVHTQSNLEPHLSLPAYGYLNYLSGTANPDAMLDFNREKDGVFLTTQPAIPIPVSTEDYFNASSQAGVQQFRPWYNSNYIVWDRPVTQVSSSTTAGVTIGAGNVFQGGAQLNLTGGTAITHQWNRGPYIKAVTPAATSNPLRENVYFKQAGEQTGMDAAYYTALGTDNTQKVMVNRDGSGNPQTVDYFTTSSTSTQIKSPITRQVRDTRTATFSYLTAAQAAQYGLDKKIDCKYPRVDQVTQGTDPVMAVVHKPHHISEVTVTDKDGKRMVYGIPVYNTDREEVSMSVAGDVPYSGAQAADRLKGLVSYQDGVDNTENNGKGRLNIYNRKTIPPYSTSWLLTGILSADYVDLTGNGISDDDLGTAVKFQYKKVNNYHWRAPYDTLEANYNEGFLSDQTDDKGNYVYGAKELWYLDTIRSKTMVAVFHTSRRLDGLGSAGEFGGRSFADTLQELDSIQLFSSADLLKNKGNAIPIKVAHFEYDYSLYPNVTNNMGFPLVLPNTSTDLNANKGKLTLRKVYFTYGTSSRGQTNPYIFSYDMRLISSIPGLPGGNTDLPELSDQYTPHEADRWGTYRQNYFTTASHIFFNSEFPYSLQPSDNETYDQRLLADRFASKWQLNSITTPTGGVINVNYESDDYSYVQDQKAMMMCSLAGVGTAKNAPSYGPSGLAGATIIYVKVPVQVASIQEFKDIYLSGPNGADRDNIYYRFYANMDNRSHWEYVSGYAEIDDNDSQNPWQMVDSHTFGIPVKTVSGYNPMAVQAWQLLQTDLPQYAYPNYDNSNVDGLAGDVTAAVKSMIQAVLNLRELGESFDKIAAGSNFANNVDVAHSLIRLNYPVGKTNGMSGAAQSTYGKLGGGSRVHSVEINDNWGSMTGGKTIAYGIRYDYTTTDDQGHLISSGVASYEPEIGNEENPFHQPVDYTEKVQWGTDRYHYMEQPFGESYFPAPGVGYSQVKATPYGTDYSNPSQPQSYSNTGYILSQFYTARDFPTQTDYLPLEEDTYEYDLTLLLFGARYTNRVTTSQGFKIVLNDMHGKPKANKTYDNNGNLVSSTEYYYNVTDPNAQRKTLNNTVLAMDASGNINGTGTLIATDAELITDLRESNSSSNGTTVGGYGGAFIVPLLFAPLYIPYASVNYSATSSLRSYNSASTIKVIHQYGLLQEVRTTQNGSTLTADNLLWDAQTGSVLLTRNQNEFNDYTYSLNYPAFRGYDGMSGAYKNMGMIFNKFSTDGEGEVTAGNLDAVDQQNGVTSNDYSEYLSPGDELVDIDMGASRHGWLIQPPGDGTFRFVDELGNFIANVSGTFMVVRSGRRNLLDESAGSVVTMVNPLIQGGNGYILDANVDEKVLDAKAVTYKDEWGLPVPNFLSANQVPTPLTVYPPIEDPDGGGGGVAMAGPNNNDVPPGIYDYFITSNGQPATCNDNTFEAGVTHAPPGRTPVPNRGYLDFGPAMGMNLPSNAVVTSAQLTLTPQQISGSSNSVYLTRVTQMLTCTQVSWSAQPSTTGTGQLQTGQMSSTTAIQEDVTTMFNDWRRGADISNFMLQLRLVNEQQPIDEVVIFNGSETASPPTLVLSYYIPGTCTNPLYQVINPYYSGVKGNWRPYYNYAYQVNRTQSGQNASQTGGTNIRNSGYYNSYTPFWQFNGQTMIPIASVSGSPGNVADPRWVWGIESIYYDQKGNEVEDGDALSRYNSVLYGYQQSMATAVASNARHNEIAFDGFEDYYFSLPTNKIPAPCPPLSLRQLDMGFALQGDQYCSNGNCIVSGISHTGNYSLNLTGSISFSSSAGNATPPSQWISYDAAGHSILASNEQAGGFAPVSGKKYLLSLWVNDGNSSSSTVNGLTVTINGQTPVSCSPGPIPVVEGWKQLNLCFTAGTTFNLQLSGGSNIYIDDIRLQPFDAQMKTFVYDDQSLRLMSQLDENNFGIVYEYDDEGTPIRVKKETERGVMTVKENRQSMIAH